MKRWGGARPAQVFHSLILVLVVASGVSAVATLGIGFTRPGEIETTDRVVVGEAFDVLVQARPVGSLPPTLAAQITSTRGDTERLQLRLTLRLAGFRAYRLPVPMLLGGTRSRAGDGVLAALPGDTLTLSAEGRIAVCTVIEGDSEADTQENGRNAP